MDMVIAALLHDVVEDTPTSYEDVAASFGERVAEIVRENSYDMSFPRPSGDERASLPWRSNRGKRASSRWRTSSPIFAPLRCPRRPAGPRSVSLAIPRAAGIWSRRAAAPRPQLSESSTRRRRMSSARSATMPRSPSRAARWWRAISTATSARPCISSICRTPSAALSERPRSTAYASSSGELPRSHSAACRGNLRCRETIDSHGTN